METKIIITILLAIIVFLIVRSKKMQKSFKEQNDELNAQVADANRLSVVRDATKSRSVQPGNRDYQPRKVLRVEQAQTQAPQRTDIDRMKRKNIQPGNQGLVPVGATVDGDGMRESFINSNQNLEHKFFGTQLELGGRVLINGLPKGLHRLEVIEGKLYVDGKPISVHPNDVDALIRQLKAND